ncbi:hypothetical protein PR048_030844 [Dryococelus australis]|uniref:Uncharacterized protein n=1 Tax=Dryococelus australis TaxID=614101 RepID=A0ABQ9GA12_9NEOP|nr:hypothetical protein PR048_030844 [Dryococelus australis]
MRAIEVNMKQRRNEVAGETGDPRENSPTNGIVRHDSPCEKKLNRLAACTLPTCRRCLSVDTETGEDKVDCAYKMRSRHSANTVGCSWYNEHFRNQPLPAYIVLTRKLTGMRPACIESSKEFSIVPYRLSFRQIVREHHKAQLPKGHTTINKGNSGFRFVTHSRFLLLLGEGFPPVWTFFPAFEAEKCTNNKGDYVTARVGTVAAKRKYLNWRAVFSSSAWSLQEESTQCPGVVSFVPGWYILEMRRFEQWFAAILEYSEKAFQAAVAERLDCFPSSSSSQVTPGFSQMGIVQVDASDRWVFSGISRFPRPCMPVRGVDARESVVCWIRTEASNWLCVGRPQEIFFECFGFSGSKANGPDPGHLAQSH